MKNNSKVKFWAVFFVMLLGASCAQEKKRTVKLSQETNTFRAERCVDEDCAEVEFIYPVFKGKRKVAEKLNAHIKEQLLMYLSWGTDKGDFDTLESAAKNFLDEFSSFKKEYSDSPQSWYIKGEGRVSNEAGDILSLIFSNHSYTGGAHPNSFSLYLNFDLSNGRLLKQEELILDKEQLLEKAENAFREYHEVDPDVNLVDDGRFFLKEGQFFLPAAMGYEGSEFVLLYNAYEIGPYSMGQTEIRFPLRELEEVVLQPE